MGTRAPSRLPISQILEIVGGVLLVVGSFTPWVTLPGADLSRSGMDIQSGWVTLVLGGVLAGVGVASRPGQQNQLAWISIVAGLAGVALGIWALINVQDLAIDLLEPVLPPEPGISAEENRAIIAQSIEQSGVGISAGVGLFLAIGGGVLGSSVVPCSCGAGKGNPSCNLRRRPRMGSEGRP